ncbi:hypothetical protein PF005_g719 [Phytophthora fragariae]|uniref:Uncharacterized protein n=1 Tax=Phytophthora fragariae TaxID=53985 RepID=A0A6A3TQZ6_9STRA|nr:hypothetical protein PF007_g272 [Phytophthora fragariae]KAE9155483.1 hypothetical protein PF006_g570 [Phytophthora fragariae]KAE9237272.1 hypothetical protein PF005_g719 [Phytophthora fragariae]
MLPNGKKKCVVEGCYRAAYQRRLCPAHGGRDKCRVQDCKNYSYTQGVCQAHSDGKPRTSSRDQKPTSTKAGVVATERDLKASGVDTNTKSHLKKPVASSNRGVRLAETKQSLGEVTMKKRPKLRTKKSLNSDAWKSSDLPNLFRNVDHKRARGTEERVVSTKREKLEISTLGVVETKSRAQVATNKATAVKVARSRPVKTEEGECKFRGCKIPVPSDGFCQKHETRERCKEKGCGHLATSKGLCSRHARRRRCEVDGCSKKSRVRGRCSQHGGKYFCRQEGCKKTAYLRGLCGAHSREAQSQTAAAWRPQSSE